MTTIDPTAHPADGQSETPDLPRRPSEMPDKLGYFGDFGGVYVPETLTQALRELEDTYLRARQDQNFRDELSRLFRTFVGRPVPFQEARRLSGHARSISQTGDSAAIWLKREDLAHTGAHKINNTLGQALLAKKMGKHRIIAETGAGQHGVATATACAHLGLKCEVYMGAEDVRRQALNVARMRMLGANVNTVDAGSRTLKDATNEAMRDWMGSVEDTHYILGSVVGPHPFPMLVRDFQSVMGREIKAQSLRHIGALPSVVIACVGGGSNAAGAFFPFIEDESVRLIGVEAGGLSAEPGQHAAPLTHGSPGVLHGSLSYVLQSGDGQTQPVHSCSAGLDYPGVGPEHAYWKDTGRVEYDAVTDDDALDAFELIAQTEGIIPALETAHAIAKAVHVAAALSRDETVVINVSGRGDKDVAEADRLLRVRDEREGEAERKAKSVLRPKQKKRKKRRRS